MHEVTDKDKGVLEIFEAEKKPPKKCKDPKGHDLEFQSEGNYERVAVYCDKCSKAYSLTREECEQI